MRKFLFVNFEKTWKPEHDVFSNHTHINFYLETGSFQSNLDLNIKNKNINSVL